MQIEIGSESEIEPFVDLLERIGAWLWDRGVHQWAPGSMRAQLPALRRDVGHGALLLARERGALAGGCIVSRRATPEWSGRPGRAAYLHKLVVAREVAGQGLGDRLLERAAAWTCERDLPLLRLDCWDGNDFLRTYYRERGFAELDAVTSHGYPVRLFETPVAKSGS